MTGVAGLILASSFALAGTIKFSVNFTGNEIGVTNTGNEAAYRLSLWTLNQSEKWQAVPLLAGNADYLAPEQSVKGVRQSPAVTNGLGRGDPLLLMMFDKSGSPVTQLAWRQPPAAAREALPTQRHGPQLDIALGNAKSAGIVATYAIAVPYGGVERLAHRFQGTQTPPDPLRHQWALGPVMRLDTGAGQGGAWLVHQTTAGDLQVQVLADGVTRGLEQVPVWINWVRRNLMRYAQLLAALGVLLLIARFVWSDRRRQALAAIPGSQQSSETSVK